MRTTSGPNNSASKPTSARRSAVLDRDDSPDDTHKRPDPKKNLDDDGGNHLPKFQKVFHRILLFGDIKGLRMLQLPLTVPIVVGRGRLSIRSLLYDSWRGFILNVLPPLPLTSRETSDEFARSQIRPVCTGPRDDGNTSHYGGVRFPRFPRCRRGGSPDRQAVVDRRGLQPDLPGQEPDLRGPAVGGPGGGLYRRRPAGPRV